MSQTGSGFWAGELDGLVGRDEALATLRELLHAGSRTAVVTGIAGAGKTSVLSVVMRAESAEGSLVLAVTCHESDRDLPYGVLVDLLTSLPAGGAVLDRVVRESRSSSVDPLQLRLDVLEVLERTAAERPVLVVLDDAQWADASSLSVLRFVAHRVADSGISVLVSTREPAGPETFGAHPLVALLPLDDADARRVLALSGLELDSLALPTVVEKSAGNPLALLELGRAALTGTAVPSSVEAWFGRQLAALPERTRHALLLAAAGDGDLRVLGATADGGRFVDDLVAAEDIGLVAVVERRVRFVHPLARAAAYSSAPTADRLRAHALLAEACGDDVERQVWHRGEATVVPDETVAVQLAEASGRAERRGAADEAARLMLRAAELTPDRAEREERTLAGIRLSSWAGHFQRVAREAEALRGSTTDERIRAGAGHVHAYALTQTGREEEARWALLDVLEELVGVEPFWAWSSLTTLAVLNYRSGRDLEVAREWLERLEQEPVPDDEPLAPIIAGARAWVVAQVDPLDPRADVLELVAEAPVLDPSYPLAIAGTHEMLLGAAAWMLDETPVALTRLQRALDLMRRAHAPGEMTQTLAALAQVQFATGAYDAVDEAGRLIRDLSEARNHSYAAIDGLEVQARAAGIRGQTERARQLCDQVLLTIPVGGAVALEANVRTTMSWVHLAEHDAPGAWEQVRWLFREDGEPRHVHLGYRDLAQHVATAARAGAVEDVLPVLAVAERRLAHARPRHRLQLAAARAIVAGEDAEPFHRAAVSDPAAGRWPFELANAQLEFGAWLRRRYRQTEARPLLQAALDTFTRLGTRAWADLARAELRAAGIATEAAGPTAWAELTSQEREVVRLAAAGRTNPEIAAAMYLSPRTVSTHLYNAFPKLGVSSRAQLRDVVPDPT